MRSREARAARDSLRSMHRVAALSAGLLSLLLAAPVAIAGPGPAGDWNAPPRCGTLERLPRAFRSPRLPRSASAGAKRTRQGFPGAERVLESTDFAAWWSDPAIGSGQVSAALAALEDAWSLYIDGLRHSPPPGADTYRINLYIAGPDDTPSIDFTGGYADIDPDGYTYLVVSRNLTQPAYEAEQRHTLAHELYHDIQLGSGGFRIEPAYWYWEATAEWAAQERYPDLPGAYAYVGAYALATEISIDYQGDPFGDPVLGLHQYGASIFPRHLTDQLGGPALVRDSWEDAGAGDDPLTVLDDLLPGSIADAFDEFAPRMALADFAHRDLIAGLVDTFAASHPDRDRFAARIGPEGTGDWARVAEGRELHGFGANVIEVQRPEGGEFRLAINFDALGTLGTPVDARVTIVRETARGIRYSPVELHRRSRVASSLVLPDQESTAYVVVAVAVRGEVPAEVFPYRFRIVPGHEPDPAEETGDDGGADKGDDGADSGDGATSDGGCAVGGSPGGALGAAFGLVLIALVARRSRRSARGRR